MNLKKSFLEHCKNNQYEINQNQLNIISNLKDYYIKNFKQSLFIKIFKKGDNKLGYYLVGEVGVGKTMFMTHMAAHSLSVNKNVLYITMEMAEERIAERIDANLLNISTDDLHSLNRKIFTDKIEKLKHKQWHYLENYLKKKEKDIKVFTL